MSGVIARKLFGSSNERRIKGYLPRVGQINALEKELEGLSDEALRARTEAFKQQVAGGGGGGGGRGAFKAAGGGGSEPRRHSGAGLCHLPRGGEADLGATAFR